MNNDHTLSILRDALTRRKKVEDQVRKSLEPIMPTLRFIAELNKIYRDVYGTDETTPDEAEITSNVTVVAKKPKTKKEVLFTAPKVPLPVGATWVNVTIAFKTGHDVSISFKDTLIGSYTYEQLGFGRGNTSWNKPNKLWGLLTVLAVAEEYKSPQTIVFTKQHLMTVCEVASENAVEKQKSDLAKALRLMLGIQEEPFMPYSPELGYRAKFKLRPEPDMRGDGELHVSGKQLIDIYSDD